MTEDLRPFRLHLAHGATLEGWAYPDGTAVALEDPEFGLTASAATAEDLLRGYGDGRRIEWLTPTEVTP